MIKYVVRNIVFGVVVPQWAEPVVFIREFPSLSSGQCILLALCQSRIENRINRLLNRKDLFSVKKHNIYSVLATFLVLSRCILPTICQ